MKVLAARSKDFSGFLVVVGDGEITKYKQITGGKAIFLGSVDDIQNIMSVVDVAVLPTFYDPSSRFILEALAACKPVITTRFNGAADLFTNKRHGIVIDSPENVTALTDAIDYFVNADNIRKASQAIVEDNLKEKISIDRVAKELMTVYELILQQRGK